MESIIKSTNEKVQKELPQLKEQKTLLQKELTEIKNFADGIMNKWASLASEDSSLFLKDKLDQLGKRRKEIETGIQALEEMIEEIERESVTQELVMLALNKVTDVFDHIQPYQQKELLSLVLHKAILAPDSIKIALYGHPPEIGLLSLCESEIRSQTPIWLPGRVIPNWWRQEGHALHPVDLEEVLAARPSVLVVGQGAFGRMQVSPAARQALEEAGIHLIALPTGEAVHKYNQLRETEKVAGAFHLTC